MMYKILAAVSLICILFSIIGKPRKLKLKNFNKRLIKSSLLTKLNEIISSNSRLYQTKEKYVSKLQLINRKNYKHNNELILTYFVINIVVSVFLLITLLNVITMYYAAIIISAVYFYMATLIGINYIEFQLIKIHRQFPAALQCFLDEYIIHKNIKVAVSNSYDKMPAEIGGAFELLTRELSGEKNYVVPIKKFANELSYVWGHSFAEILLLSYEGAGDITDDLLTLNSMVSEEITSEEEEKSSRYGNKLTFFIVYAVALLGLIINLFINDLARHLYFYTGTGNSLIATWLIILIVGVTIISLTEKGR